MPKGSLLSTRALLSTRTVSYAKSIDEICHLILHVFFARLQFVERIGEEGPLVFLSISIVRILLSAAMAARRQNSHSTRRFHIPSYKTKARRQKSRNREKNDGDRSQRRHELDVTILRPWPKSTTAAAFCVCCRSINHLPPHSLSLAQSYRLFLTGIASSTSPDLARALIWKPLKGWMRQLKLQQ